MRQTLDDAGGVLGSVQYDPWGVPTAGTPQPFGFTGELHHNGQVYLRARWYAPGQGRFVSVDPFAGWSERPYSLHAYQYAYSNPVSFIDPGGQIVIEDRTDILRDGVDNRGGCAAASYDQPGCYTPWPREVLDGRGPTPRPIRGIVLHDTATSEDLVCEEIIGRWLNDFHAGNSQSSAHYVIDREGSVVQAVADIDVAHTSGGVCYENTGYYSGHAYFYNTTSHFVVHYRGFEVNEVTLNIEVIGDTAREDPDIYPPAQRQATVEVTRMLARLYNILPGNIVSHHGIESIIPPNNKVGDGTALIPEIRRAVRNDWVAGTTGATIDIPDRERIINTIDGEMPFLW